MMKWRCGANIFIRAFHTSICLIIPASLIVKDSALRNSFIIKGNPWYGICYVVLLLFSLSMYFTACLVDPGYVPLKKKHAAVNNNSDDDDDDEDTSSMLKNKMSQKGSGYRYCDFCEIQQPMRTKHCEDCKRCIRKFDHHCPWLETCIGERNHKFFWLFLMSTLALILWTMYITCSAVKYEFTWGAWFKTNYIFFLDILVLAIGGLVVAGLLAFHSYLMVRGTTTWESVSRERITYLKHLKDEYNPFDEGIFKNMYHFLCMLKNRRWEKLYAKKASDETKDDIV